MVSPHRWDSVIDLTRQSGQVRRAVRGADATPLVFVSSLNVHRAFDRPRTRRGQSHRGALGGDVLADMTEYGSAKVACERRTCSLVPATRSSDRAHRRPATGPVAAATTLAIRQLFWFRSLVPPDLSFPSLSSMSRICCLAAHLCRSSELVGTFRNATGVTTTLSAVLALAQSVAGSSVPAMAVLTTL